MKHSYIFLLIFTAVMFFVGCTSPQTPPAAENMNYYVAKELEKIDGADSLEEETIKALSVIIRTNLKSGALPVEDYSSNSKSASDSGASSGSANEKFLSLANQTSDEVLLNNDSLAPVNISGEKTWEVEIKKADLLDFFNKHNISLANISKIVPVFDENHNLLYLDICGKQLSYELLKKEFNLKSNKITNIQNSVSSIKITGAYGEETFDYLKANQLSAEGKTYKEILKNYFETYTIS